VVDPRFSHRAENVVRALEQVCPKIGFPKTIRVAVCIEAFNGRFRAECLNAHLPTPLRRYYNPVS
jgi:putative transposase